MINSEQLPELIAPEPFAGVRFTGKTARDKTTVTFDGKRLADTKIPFEYHLVELKGAKVLLKTANGKPLATVFRCGKGKVILTLQKYLVEDPATAGQKNGVPAVHYLLSLLRHELLPFRVVGNSPAEMVVSRQKNGWRVSLLNNRGVYKQPLTAPVVVPSEKTEQTLIFPMEIESATEQITGRKLAIRKINGQCSVKVTIPAGDLVIIDVVTKK